MQRTNAARQRCADEELLLHFSKSPTHLNTAVLYSGPRARLASASLAASANSFGVRLRIRSRSSSAELNAIVGRICSDTSAAKSATRSFRYSR